MAKTDKTSNIYINGKQAGDTIADLRKRFRELNNEVQHLKPGTEDYKKKVNELSSVKGKLDEHTKQVRGIGQAYKEVGGNISGVMSITKGVLAAGGIMKIVDLAVSGISNWITSNKDLEKSLSSLRSLTGASAEDIEFYKNEAIQLGESTTQSATQVIDAMKLVGSARPELLKNKEALVDVTRETIALAEAAEMDMGPAAQALTGILNQFNLESTDSSRVINTLAAGSKEGAAGIESLSQTIDKSGAVMAGYNITVEEGIGLAETLAEKNIKGAEAGTNLRNVLLTMQGIEALPEKALTALDKFGVDTAIVADATLPLNERLTEMSKISGDATAMMQVFGKENIVAASAILGNTEKVQKYTDAVTGTNTAYEQQAINNDNLEGDLLSLSSAWEGLNLTLEGSNSILRYVVQTGTEIISWIKDTIDAFKNWDVNALETSLLKVGSAILSLLDPFNLWSGSMQDAIDDQIRLNELTGQVIDKISEKSRSLKILTNTLAENQAALKSGNTTLEEENRIKEENAKIIDTLKDKYPEFTDQIDLQTASFEELTQWQEMVTENILKQAIEEVKAAEQKRLLNEIIQETIELSKQQAKEAERWAVTNAIADVFADDSEDIEENIHKMKGQLSGLNETFDDVEDKVKDLDINFAADFDTNNELIAKSTEELKLMEQQLAKTTGSTNLFLDAQLEAYQSILQQAQQTKQQMIDDELKKEQELNEKKIEEQKKFEEKKRQETSKNLQKEFERLQKELEKLEEFELNKRLELENKKRLLALEGMELELEQAQQSIDAKYAKEIASAQALAQRTDQIGQEARERLASLEILKADELGAEKARITAEWTKKEEAEKKAIRQQAAQDELLIRDTQLKTAMALAQMQYQDIADWEVQKKADALQAIQDLEMQAALLDQERRMTDLEIQYENEAISYEEFLIYKEEIEAEHLARVADLNREHNARTEEDMRKSIEGALGAIQQVSQALGAFRDAQHQNEMAQIERQKKAEIKALDEQLAKGIITEEEYQRKLQTINEEAERKEAEEKRKKAEADKKAALIEAAIATALAIVKAAPNPALMALAAVVSGIQIAAIAAQPIPQFKEGGFKVTGAQDGKNYNATYIGKHPGGMLPNKPVVLASEAGPEYFVPNPLLHHPEVIDHVRAIENIRTGGSIRQFAEGGATEQLPEATQQQQGMDMAIFQQLLQMMELNLIALTELRDLLPNLAVVIGDDKVDELRERMEQIESIRA